MQGVRNPSEVHQPRGRNHNKLPRNEQGRFPKMRHWYLLIFSFEVQNVMEVVDLLLGDDGDELDAEAVLEEMTEAQRELAIAYIAMVCWRLATWRLAIGDWRFGDWRFANSFAFSKMRRNVHHPLQSTEGNERRSKWTTFVPIVMSLTSLTLTMMIMRRMLGRCALLAFTHTCPLRSCC